MARPHLISPACLPTVPNSQAYFCLLFPCCAWLQALSVKKLLRMFWPLPSLYTDKNETDRPAPRFVPLAY
jgi:hypothetical protein